MPIDGTLRRKSQLLPGSVVALPCFAQRRSDFSDRLAVFPTAKVSQDCHGGFVDPIDVDYQSKDERLAPWMWETETLI